MHLNLQEIAGYERVMPLCMQPMIGVMPGVDVILRDDLSLMSSTEYPSPDANQAFLLRATDETANALIDEVIAYFNAKEVPAAIFTSPACTPSNLSQHLLRRGFVKQEPDESWLVYENLQAFKQPRTDPKIVVRQVESSEAGLFAEVMATAYEMPSEWVPVIANALGPSIGHPNFHHYLAFINQKPLATIILMRYQNQATIGGAGVLPQHRGSSLIFNLAAHVLEQARLEGVDSVVLQTTLGPIFERFLRICGFTLAFRRTGYTLA